MEHIIFTESTEVYDVIKKILPEEYTLISIDKIYNKNKLGLIESLILDDELLTLKTLISNSSTIHLVFTDSYFRIQDIYAKLLDYFCIDVFSKVELDNLDLKNIQNAFSASQIVEKDEINYMIAKSRIDTLVNKDLNNILKWFFKKNNIVSVDELDKMTLNRLIIYALSVLVPTQFKADTFEPDTYDRVGVDYIFKGIQFRVKNNKKFKRDMKEELMVLFNMTCDKDNFDLVEKFDRSVKTISAPTPLNKTILQKDASYTFGYRPKETLKIASELFNGIKIHDEVVSLITTFNTSSLKISEKKKEKLRNLIEQRHGLEYFFVGDRNLKKNKDHETKEAILPTSFSEEYFPKKIKSYLSEDQFKLYNYIFWRTVASQMSNATYDDTEIVVNIGGEKFKAVANAIIYDGWHKEGAMYDADLSRYSEEKELPHEIYVGMELAEFRLEAVTFKTKERTPMKYSTARFFDKANKELLAEPTEITLLIDDLVESGLAKLEARNMFIPTERGKRIFFTLEEYAPTLIDLEFILKTQSLLEDVRGGRVDGEFVVNEYVKQISKLRNDLKYTQDAEPGEWKIEEAKKIAKEKGQKVSEAVLENKTLLNSYIKNNEDRIEKLGICPNCKKGEIFEKEKGYFCNKADCDLILWKNNLNRFFQNFSKDIDSSVLNDYIRVILKKDLIKVDNLFSNDKFFDREITISYNEKFNNWGFSFYNKFTKPIVEIKENSNNDIDKEAYGEDGVNYKEKSIPQENENNEHEPYVEFETSVSLCKTIVNKNVVYICSEKNEEIWVDLLANELNNEEYLRIEDLNTCVVIYEKESNIKDFTRFQILKAKSKQFDINTFCGMTIVENEDNEGLLALLKEEILRQKEKIKTERREKF